jgi:hypothetical protein
MKLKYKIAISLRYRSIECTKKSYKQDGINCLVIICHQLVVNRNDFFIEALLRKNAFAVVLFFICSKNVSVPSDSCVVECEKSQIESIESPHLFYK